MLFDSEIRILHVQKRNNDDGRIIDEVVQATCAKCGFVSSNPMDVYRSCFCQREVDK